MPVYLGYSRYSHYCHIKDSKREFTTEKERKTYVKRHCKMCVCSYEIRCDAINDHLTHKSITKTTINDISQTS